MSRSNRESTVKQVGFVPILFGTRFAAAMWRKKRANKFWKSPYFPLAPGVFLAYIAGNASEKARN
jgi:hypothetical protein